MIFDIYIPTLAVALEYQGLQHYQGHYIYGDTKYYNERDDEKRKACKSMGISLIEVPYWWQHDKVLLYQSTDKFSR